MKESQKIIFTGIILLFLSPLNGVHKLYAQDQSSNTITLPAFNLEGKGALNTMERVRETKRLSDRSVDLKVVSEILWAAHGITASGGNTTTHGLDAVSGATLNADERYTVPVAWYRKFLKIYYISADGIYEYNSAGHSLTRLSKRNLLDDMGGTVPNAAGRIVVAIDKNEHTDPEMYAYLTIGMVAQNIYLACASNDLLTGSQGVFSKNILINELNLSDNIDVAFMTSFGYQR